jgi:hypothetical protein
LPSCLMAVINNKDLQSGQKISVSILYPNL